MFDELFAEIEQHLKDMIVPYLMSVLQTIAYCIYSHRYQEIIIFLVVGMILMVGMFAVTIIEGMCDSLIEKISDL
jgi:branched-subunit amino acid transport protein